MLLVYTKWGFVLFFERAKMIYIYIYINTESLHTRCTKGETNKSIYKVKVPRWIEAPSNQAKLMDTHTQ